MENKWWEYYTVRYFIGTVIGAVIVVFLNGETGSPYENLLPLIEDFKEAEFLGVGLIAALGFSYCYIASAPILIVHATRAHLRLSTLNSHWLIHSVLLTICIGAAIGGAWRILPPIAAVGAGFVVGFQVGLLLLALVTKFSIIVTFYRELAVARAKSAPENNKPPSAGQEYITSYRHLREHGNAFMIVVLEGVLAYCLFHLPSAECAFYFLAAWVLPGAASWLLGTVLESRLVSRPLP